MAEVRRDPAHATQAAVDTQGEKRLLLVFPQQSRNKHTMALVLRDSDSEELSGEHGPGLREQDQGGSAGMPTSHSAGLRGQRAKEPGL